MTLHAQDAAPSAAENHRPQPIDPATLAAIVAAATAFLGTEVELRSVKPLGPAQGSRWSRQGRATVHASHNLHARR
jgi:hypothetical protein